MKTLIVTRHAKSSWNNRDQRDFDRPLNARGERDTPDMSQRLIARGPLPDFVVSSTACRALQTTELLLNEFDTHPQLITTEAIYEAPLPALLSTVGEIPDTTTIAMLVGHNPGVSALSNHLCLQAHIEMPTCAMACLDLDIESWNECHKDCATLRWYDYPKNR